MECQGLVNTFATALKRTSIVIDRKPSIPVLSNVRIEAFDTQAIKFAGTNNYLTMGCRMAASVTTPGVVGVDQQRLYDLVSRFPQDKRLTLKMNGDKLVVRCAGASYELAVINADDLPPSPKPGKGDRVEIAASTLLRLLTVAGKAMLENDDRAHLSGVWLEWDGKMISAFATDGLRLIRIEKPNPATGQGAVFIPHRAVTGMRKFAETVPLNTIITTSVSGPNLHFWVEAAGFSSKMVESKKFDYKRALPEKSTARAEVPAPQLVEALTRLRVVSPDEPIRFYSDKAAGKLELTAASGVGTGKELIKGSLKGGEAEVVLPSAHVLDFLDVVGPRAVRVSFSGGQAAAVLTPTEGASDETVIGAVMPIQEQP